MKENNRLTLKADCENCFGLCCVALPFAASSDFAIDKEGGTACQNLQPDFRCGIHSSLRERGFRGCTVYDCFGAGQQVSQVTFGGSDWRKAPGSAKQMFEVFPIMWQLHELLWYVSEALTLQPARPIHTSLQAMFEKTKRFTELPADDLKKLDVAGHRAEVNEWLLKASELVRDEARRGFKGMKGNQKKYGRGVDLIGAKLKGADLRCTNLRGAYLIAADLRGADLRVADVIGADFRDADLRGADLTECIFLTQAQLNAAKGDGETKIPPSLSRPEHWS